MDKHLVGVIKGCLIIN